VPKHKSIKIFHFIYLVIYNLHSNPWSSNKSLTCRDVTTPANDWGGGNSIYLDRHDVSCNENEVISKVHLTRPTGGEISYQYKCCKY